MTRAVAGAPNVFDPEGELLHVKVEEGVVWS
jgi:hypothetical protein